MCSAHTSGFAAEVSGFTCEAQNPLPNRTPEGGQQILFQDYTPAIAFDESHFLWS